MVRLCLCVLTLLGGCHSLWRDDDLVGNGRLVDVRAYLPPFSGVDVTNSFDVTIALGDADVVMTLDDNIVAANLVRLTVERGVLVVDQCDDCRDFAPSPGASLRITSPRIDEIRASGQTAVTAAITGDATLVAADESHLAVTARAATTIAATATGAARLDLTATASLLVLAASDEATLRSTQLAPSVDVTARDAASVTAAASASTHVRASDESSVTIAGQPRDRTIDVRDAARVSFP